jgi:hypothetical protein
MGIQSHITAHGTGIFSNFGLQHGLSSRIRCFYYYKPPFTDLNSTPAGRSDLMNIVVDLQILYALTGAIYNIVSIVRVRLGRRSLSATNPYLGIIIMAAVAAVTLSQPYLHGAIYLVGWSFLVVFIGLGPVTAHFKAIRQADSLHLYASPLAAYLAFGINALGVTFGCIGIVMAFSGLLNR